MATTPTAGMSLVWVLPAWFLQVNRCLVDEMSRRFQILNMVGWLFLAFSFQINDLFSPNISIDRYSHLVAGVFLAFLNTIEFFSHDGWEGRDGHVHPSVAG